jgi:hypothetical protein
MFCGEPTPTLTLPGSAVTPAGSPDIVTVTDSEKPFSAFTLIPMV